MPRPVLRSCLAAAAFVATGSIAAQPFTPDQGAATAAAAHVVARDTLYAHGDWSAAIADAADKDLVLIGEPDHGSKEVFELRNGLIAELNAKHGFDVVLFESGMGELIAPYEHRGTWSPEQLANGLMGPWNTRSSAALMDTLQRRTMEFAGFDVQRSGRSFATVLGEVCAQLGLDSALHVGLEERYTTVTKTLGPKADAEAVRSATETLIADYEDLHRTMMARTRRERPTGKMLFTQRTLKNRAAYLRYMLRFTADKNWNARWAARDSAMTDNVMWLKEVLYPDRKVVVVAHNYHIARHNPNADVMGEQLDARYGERMLVIGTFAGDGSYADNARRPQAHAAPDSARLDIKHVIAALDGAAHYLPLPKPATAGTAWAHAPVVVNGTFIDLGNSDTLVPAEHFDALLLIGRVSPPVFLDP